MKEKGFSALLLLIGFVLIVLIIVVSGGIDYIFFHKTNDDVLLSKIVNDVRYENSGSCTLKKWKGLSIDCGGGMPSYSLSCGHWVQLKEYTDEGKSCLTGEDCCSGFCGKDYNGKLSCITYETCNTYIDKDGKLVKIVCVR